MEKRATGNRIHEMDSNHKRSTLFKKSNHGTSEGSLFRQVLYLDKLAYLGNFESSFVRPKPRTGGPILIIFILYHVLNPLQPSLNNLTVRDKYSRTCQNGSLNHEAYLNPLNTYSNTCHIFSSLKCSNRAFNSHAYTDLNRITHTVFISIR